MNLATVGVGAVQLALVVVGGPLLLGLMRRVRSRLEGRDGPPITQPWRDIAKLAHKQRTRPTESSWIFAAAPLVLVATAATVAALGPLISLTPPLATSTDFIAVIFVLLVGSVALALAALDTGTAFGGMGASRALTIGALVEPALLVAVLALSLPLHSTNLVAIVADGSRHASVLVGPSHLLALASFIVVILAESGRLPVDNPSTHLELTMIYEALILEYSGPDLALVTLGESMRLAIWLGLFVNLVAPVGIASHAAVAGLVLGLVVVAVKVALVGTIVAVYEVTTAKLRLFRLPELLAGGFILALLGVVTGAVMR